jgi:hypothetical protein
MKHGVQLIPGRSAPPRNGEVVWLSELTRETLHDVGGTCDMGECNRESAALVYDDEHGWLPVCVRHTLNETRSKARST